MNLIVSSISYLYSSPPAFGLSLTALRNADMQYWEDSTAALARVQAKHDQHDEIMLAANEAHRLRH
jgi:hypothetical protein